MQEERGRGLSVANHPEFGSLRMNPRGYLRVNSGEFRNWYVHRAEFKRIAGRDIKPGFVVHHMGPKDCWCGCNLLECPPEFNPPPVPERCPNTGRFLKKPTAQERIAYAKAEAEYVAYLESHGG